MKVKIFTTRGDQATSLMEESINDWFRKTLDVKVIEIKQSLGLTSNGSFADVKIVTSIFYEEISNKD
jgi:20S proteasome alpha/beta subunit